jgi:hypothetical protein
MVEVGTGEMTYTGTLIEINENEVYLESEGAGWIVIPTEKIAYIREANPE